MILLIHYIHRKKEMSYQGRRRFHSLFIFAYTYSEEIKHHNYGEYISVNTHIKQCFGRYQSNKKKYSDRCQGEEVKRC